MTFDDIPVATRFATLLQVADTLERTGISTDLIAPLQSELRRQASALVQRVKLDRTLSGLVRVDGRQLPQRWQRTADAVFDVLLAHQQGGDFLPLEKYFTSPSSALNARRRFADAMASTCPALATAALRIHVASGYLVVLSRIDRLVEVCVNPAKTHPLGES